MKRTSLLLVAVLALVLAACGGDQAEATAEATVTVAPTVEPTEAATPSPTEEPTSSPDATDDDGSGATGELAEVLPDEVAGLSRQEFPVQGMDEMIANSLEQQGLDAEDADFAFAMYGQGQLIVTGISMPGVDQPQLELIAQMMSGMQGVEGAEDLETETVTVGGKEVIRMTTAGQPQSVFMYIGQGTMFTVVAESEDLAAELLSQLP